MSTLEATIISVFPFDIREAKPGLIPPEFFIPAAAPNDFSILHVGLCETYIYLDSNRGSLAMKEFADIIAESVVRDFITAQFEYKGEHCKPGLMWIPKKLSKEQITKDYQPELKALRDAQRQWFIQLVKIADDSWNRVKKHSEISDIQRRASKELGLKREWVIDYVSIGSDEPVASVSK